MDKPPPRVSVLMPAYNAQSTITETVESILRQTLNDFEFIIVDDGSTDATLELLQNFAQQDARLHILSRPNTGIVGALNDGLALCQGQFIARMDADDIAYPERLSAQVQFLDTHPNCVGVGSWVQFLDPDGSPIWTWKMNGDPQTIANGLLEGSVAGLVHPAMMLRSDAVEAVGGYRQACTYVEDFDLFLRLSQLGNFSIVPQCLLGYRQLLTSINATRNRADRIAIKNALLAEARAKKGLPPKTLVPAPLSPEGTLLEWVGLALIEHNFTSARKTLWRIFKQKPFGSAFRHATGLIASSSLARLRVKAGALRQRVFRK